MSHSRREVALNWLALGLLLAAWNATDDAADGARVEAQHAPLRPTALRGYALVSVRALKRLPPSINDGACVSVEREKFLARMKNSTRVT